MTPDRGPFVNMIMTRTWVTVASGQEIVSSERGDVIIKLDDEQVRMTDVLFVPELDANLLSIKALQAKGMTIKFGLGIVEITRDNQLIATGSLVDKMYILKSSRSQVALVSTEVAKPNPKESKGRDKYILWHGRMRHPGPQRMKRLYDVSNGTDRLDIKHLDKCITCTYTKMTRVVNRTPPFQATKKGERTYQIFGARTR